MEKTNWFREHGMILLTGVVIGIAALWSISLLYGTTVEALVNLNPQIKNPNLIYPGEQVRVK